MEMPEKSCTPGPVGARLTVTRWASPRHGPADEEVRFPCRRLGIAGPEQTPAEVRMLRTLGADAVGMYRPWTSAMTTRALQRRHVFPFGPQRRALGTVGIARTSQSQSSPAETADA